MPDEKRLDLTPITVRLAALWVAAGAFFKLFAGTPNDLPPVLHDLPMSIDLFFKLAIGIELTIVFAALLRPRLGWLPLVALFVVFDVILAVAMSEGAESCGCFGSTIAIPPWVMMLIDTVLLIAVLIGKPWASRTRTYGPVAAIPLLAIAAMIAPFLIVGGQAPRYVVIEPESWKDQLVYDTPFAELFPSEIETLPTDGLYVFWRWDCDHCAEHLRELADADDLSTPIVLVRLMQSHDNEENRAVLAMPTGSHVTKLSLPPEQQYVIETPAEFVLEGGVVVSAREGIREE
jgi:hypothetical protein